MSKNKKIITYIVSYLVAALIAFIFFYVKLPAINLQSEGFWFFMLLVGILAAAPIVLVSMLEGNRPHKYSSKGIRISELFPYSKIIIGAFSVFIIAFLLLKLFSSEVFFAKKYASVITVTESVFEEDMPEAETVTNIALMDTKSASIIGNRTLGSLSDVISQYEISPVYSQINYSGLPKKVANLEYADFFKWLGNKEKGIPGYVMVDPVGNTAEYVKLEKGLKYVDSAFFGDDLLRKLRFDYPTKIFNSIYYEIDDDGNPKFIVSCLSSTVGLFGAKDVSEVIVFDPCTGDSQKYSVSETPSWIDIVYTGDLAEQKYNWHGMLAKGFWNSVIGNVDCKTTTDDYGYITLGDDVWYFTGVTSVNGDESNIGFIISNARTGEYKFYPVIGAEEYSAMLAAEGEVQQMRYSASFPALINVSGEATYIMVLKDMGGLVKLYALVNVEQYGIVATGETQADAITAYKKKLAQNGIGIPSSPEKDLKVSVTVIDVDVVNVDSAATVYITCSIAGEEKTVVFKGNLSKNEALILIRPNDVLDIVYEKTETDRIFNITSWTFTNTAE